MKLPLRVKDITGIRFGSLVALELNHIQEPKNTAYWKYRCDCGKEYVARGNVISLQSKRAKNLCIPSCGCKTKEVITKHGYRHHPLYRTYKGMKERCYNTTSPVYPLYGAKGITMCEEWLSSVTTFIEWSLANGWSPELQIDKDILSKAKGISPAIYSPETCQWITPKVNVAAATNRDNFGSHPNIKLSHEQVQEILQIYNTGTMNGVELAKLYQVGNSCIYRLIRLDKLSKG